MSRDADIVAYLLGESSPEEGAAVERRMGEDAGFRREVERMRPIVAGLEALPPEAWEPGRVPPLPDPPPLPAAPAPERPRPRRAWWPVAAVAACLACWRRGWASAPWSSGATTAAAAGRPSRSPGSARAGPRRRARPVSCPPTTAGCGCG